MNKYLYNGKGEIKVYIKNMSEKVLKNTATIGELISAGFFFGRLYFL
jgi:hypothetical protein